MALFHCLKQWKQPYEPFLTPEAYLNLSSVSFIITNLTDITEEKPLLHQFGYFYLYIF